MPELPEVETAARDLRPHLIGRTIQRARVTWARIIAHPTASAFAKQIAGCTITAITRRGKYLVFELERRKTDRRRQKSEDERRTTKKPQPITNHQQPTTNPQDRKFLLVHLRMTGRFGFYAPRAKREPHQHVHLLLDDGRELRFHDFRKFGRWWLVDDPASVVGNLGPEPLEIEEREFQARLRQRRGRLKPLLLNQTFVAGIGNIYADEALWTAKIHPLREVTTLREDEIGALYRAIRRVLRKAIQSGGTSFDVTYRRLSGMSGEFQKHLRVVGRAGEPCLRCGTAIVRIVVGQRGTYYCPHCQC